jgi:hypothetical protein
MAKRMRTKIACGAILYLGKVAVEVRSKFRILRQLGDNLAQEFAAFVRQNCRTLPTAPWEVPVKWRGRGS